MKWKQNFDLEYIPVTAHFLDNSKVRNIMERNRHKWIQMTINRNIWNEQPTNDYGK